MINLQNFSKNLQFFLTKLSLSPKLLSLKTNIPLKTIREWLNNTSSPDESNIQVLCAYLCIQPHHFEDPDIYKISNVFPIRYESLPLMNNDGSFTHNVILPDIWKP